ncbi:hypothetical protein G7Y89_g13065 [Cudoniella acicularis]|uniref:Uncharacterized protein n=1 Tax=Cudoniella acicularis TaxID=354080 RepID=A0A8H4RAC4_9HELO|nr:hypothetical protein G7Y89_g13065 [Cudoniella acicularis]
MRGFHSLILAVSSSFGFAQATISLGAASTYGALSYATITNTGPTEITGDIGTTGTSITGFPPGIYTGSKYIASQATTSFQAAQAAYEAVATLPGAITLVGNLGGRALGPGTYKFPSSAILIGDLTLVGTGSCSDAWYFQIGSTLTTSTGSAVVMAESSYTASSSSQPTTTSLSLSISSTANSSTAFFVTFDKFYNNFVFLDKFHNPLYFIPVSSFHEFNDKFYSTLYYIFITFFDKFYNNFVLFDNFYNTFHYISITLLYELHDKVYRIPFISFLNKHSHHQLFIDCVFYTNINHLDRLHDIHLHSDEMPRNSDKLPTPPLPSGLTVSTVYTTKVYTITKCPATVTNCPVGSVTTDIISLYTTICPITPTTPTPQPQPQLPSGFTVSTVYTTKIYTVTKCAATATHCPIGAVTTEIISLYTTLLPVAPSTVLTSQPNGVPARPASTLLSVAAVLPTQGTPAAGKAASVSVPSPAVVSTATVIPVGASAIGGTWGNGSSISTPTPKGSAGATGTVGAAKASATFTGPTTNNGVRSWGIGWSFVLVVLMVTLMML